MTNPLAIFQKLLRELFQFDCADLDFGIYRIMNRKREVIERFITDDLPKAVAEQLDSGALAEQVQAEEELQEVRQRIGGNLGDDAIDADGNLAERYHSTPLGKEYLELKAKSAGGQGRDALEAEIFNHLYSFFSRYYQDGDFISKRRYSKHQRYAIPYNGEEVHLHWANSDQYYIKTGEHFLDYSFAVRDIIVHFKLQAANVEQDNVKGDKRFFLPCAEAIAWDEEARRLDIPFEYRPMTEQEGITYGKKNQQETIITKAVAEIPKQLDKTPDALVALTGEKRRNEGGQAVSFLEHHLRQYTRRNTSDFFIHKDLKGFLSRELDFYLKNEVLNLDQMETAGEDRAEGWFQMMRTIRSVGDQIIDFLDQIEGFQKMLWEKRKFVTETHYCITVGNIAGRFYADIAGCEAQWDEWKALFSIDEDQIDLFNSGKDKTGKRVAFLETHPTLVLDSKHFDQDFVDRLLGSFDDLEGMIDGLLIHSENWQALNFLFEKNRDDVKCVYIDPPFNTAASEILYKNDYKHSSWLSLMNDRLIIAMTLVNSQGTLCVAIDDSEYHRLRDALSSVFGKDAVLGTAIIRSNPAGRSNLTGFSVAHEYAIFVANTSSTVVGRLPKSEDQIARYKERDAKSQFELVNFRKHGGYNANRFARPRLFYPIYASDSGTVRIPSFVWNNREGEGESSSEPVKGEVIVYPINEKGEEKTWKWGHETAIKKISDLTARPDRMGKLGIYMKSRLRQGTLPSTLWTDKKYSATDYGTNLLAHILGSSNAFSFPKSVYTVADCLRVCQLHDGDYCVDYFAGSGTTGHAIINLNREDGGQRNFILVEMGDHFDTVLLPRIKKVAFTPEWKDGKPKRMATPQEAERGPRLVKYMRLESYEDALNNIDFDEDSAQQALQFDDYLLKYMLQWETKRSATLLNVEKLSQPFRYTLHIHDDGQTRQQIADIPETFNYLLGLRVETRRVYYDDDRRYVVYRGQIDQQRVAVIWRETQGWDKDALVRDKEFVAEQQMTDGADDVYVNGDSLIREAKALEPVFKRRMFAETQA